MLALWYAVFEPRYVHMFEDLQRSASTADAEVKFGHILSPAHAPPVLMEDAVGGLPPIGVMATVKSVRTRQDGTLAVEYNGQRRFKLLSLWQHAPYQMGAVEWYDDDLQPELQPLTDTLERDLYKLLLEVSRCSAELKLGGAQLSPGVHRYAPPPVLVTTGAAMQAAHPAGASIATWKRHGSVYDSVKDADRVLPDPYQVLAETVGKEQRQEMFSFAAAGLLELGPIESIALLQSRDTSARLQWVLAAVQPHLQQLRAKLAVKLAVD